MKLTPVQKATKTLFAEKTRYRLHVCTLRNKESDLQKKLKFLLTNALWGNRADLMLNIEKDSKDGILLFLLHPFSTFFGIVCS